MNVYQRPSFVRALKKLTPAQQEAVRAGARRTAQIIGHPHLHSGSGMRPFGAYKEFRVGLNLRCLFLLEGGDMHLVTVGTHDQVGDYLRNNA